MESFIIFLNRRKTFEVMKFLIFILPIFLITKKYSFSEYDKLFLFHHVSIFQIISYSGFIYAIIFFILLTFISYAFEKYLFPIAILLLFKTTFKQEQFKKFEIKIENWHKKLFGENVLVKIENINKLEMYGYYMFIPIVIFLWAIYLGNLFSIFLVLTTLILMYFFYKSLNTFYKEYGKSKN